MAKVTRGVEELTLSGDMKRRLEHIGKISLKLIEVQTGGYLGQDDIAR